MAEQIPPPSSPTPAAAGRERRCRCGHDRTHPQVHPEPKYTTLGWFLLLMGATPNPQYALYRCSLCRDVLGATKDPAVLREFTT